MRSLVLPYLRSGRFVGLRAQTKLRLLLPPSEDRRLPVRFIVGCGRSGTTILGSVLSENPEALHLSEPYHLWAGIDRRMDVTGLHADPAGTKFFLDEHDLTDQAKARYDILLARSGKPGVHRCVIEKTPHNAARIGWINQAEPNAKFVHIVRNGFSVVRSIRNIISNPTYSIAFKRQYDQWWGYKCCKWKALSTQGSERGYFRDEVGMLETPVQRAAYEWLVSIGEVDSWRDQLADQLCEITYTQLTTEPEATCTTIAEHFEINSPASWLEKARGMLREERVYKHEDLVLPPTMASKLNEYQERFGFEGRAKST